MKYVSKTLFAAALASAPFSAQASDQKSSIFSIEDERSAAFAKPFSLHTSFVTPQSLISFEITNDPKAKDANDYPKAACFGSDEKFWASVVRYSHDQMSRPIGDDVFRSIAIEDKENSGPFESITLTSARTTRSIDFPSQDTEAIYATNALNVPVWFERKYALPKGVLTVSFKNSLNEKRDERLQNLADYGSRDEFTGYLSKWFVSEIAHLNQEQENRKFRSILNMMYS